MKTIPPVSSFMTPIPHCIEASESLSAVCDVMSRNGIRHLPVMLQGKLIGIVSERAVRVISTLPGGEIITAGNVMASDPYTVAPETPLDEVVLAMSERRIGSALVVGERGKVLGIFTAIDALRVLAETLRRVEAGTSLEQATDVP